MWSYFDGVRVELKLTVVVRPDESMAGMFIATINELDVSTTFREDENLFPILDDLVAMTLQYLASAGTLADTIQAITGITGPTPPPPELVAKYQLEKRSHISLT